MRRKQPLTREDKEEIKELYAGSVKVNSIKKLFKISSRTLYSIIGKKRRGDNLSKEKIRLLVQDYENGISVEGLIKKHKVAVGTVYYHTKKRRRKDYSKIIESVRKNPPSESDLNYIAGFIDGDGSIQILRLTRKENGYVYFAPKVEAVNANRDVILFLEKSFKVGRIFRRKIVKRQLYKWSVYNKAGIRLVLNLLKDKLKIKQERAFLVLDLIKAKQMKDKKKQRLLYKQYKDIITV